MNDTENLADTIKPKSDQLNADDLLTGPITVVVKNVTRGPVDQPVHVHVDGHQPYKPCKTMRRVLIAAWGANGHDWIGRSMTLFCDATVVFGKSRVGGIRISHLSHIDGVKSMLLTHSRGRKAEFTVHPLVEVDYSDLIAKYTDLDADGKNKMWETLDRDQQAAIHKAFDAS